MKVAFQLRNRGNTLMIALFFCMCIGLVLASVLKLISARYTNTVRSTDWNAAIPVLEAGVEEAMAHLHDDATPGANSWTAGTIGTNIVYTKQRTFTDGSYFYATIYGATSVAPTIYSQGFVRSPMKASQYIARTVRVGTTNPPSVFTKAIATSAAITLQGSGIVDGFDSRNGAYSILTNRNATGNIATDSTARPAFDGQSAHVYGSVVTGPGGTATVSGSGAIGDAAWNAGSTGIETGWTNNNMNVAFPTNPPPTNSGFLSPTAISQGGSNATFLGNSAYSTTTFTSSQSTAPLIVTGNAVLYVTGALTVSGSGFIQIRPGASLTLYVGGTTTISGGGVVNGTGLASNFSLIGLNSCSRMDYTGSSAFIGTINAPQAAITISGAAGVFGAIIAQTVTLSGNMHYDDALGVSNGLIATGWVEL